MDQDTPDQGIFRLLDDNIKRSNKLGDFFCGEIIHLSYWEVRYILPSLVMEGVDAVVSHFSKENHTLAEKVSFYFWIKDELQEIANMERDNLSRQHYSPRKSKSSQRSIERYYLVELYNLSDGCVLKAEKIKKMKYSVIFEAILASVIKADEEWIQYNSGKKQ